MHFRYHILSDLNLILESYSGEYEFKDIFECKRMEMQDPNWKDYYDVLGDIRNGKITLTSDDLVNIHSYLKNHQEINAQRKSAILTNLPYQVVFGTLLKGTNNNMSMVKPEVFSTIEAALSWLGIDTSESERVEKLLSRLSEEEK
ncbi:hypothetical protein [Carboxylicivirga caseinilyticus]|uniref:hypothetical protein n=1 Tax=Carboxylicivirga caseinilyticus TaxID=3417572 RepID=UPI003D345FB9|nr:hypothetical protein [Marinilabiliaceae bacterium A049]